MILHRYDLGWLIPFLLYLCITLRLLTLYVPVSIVTRPAYWVWDHTARPFVRLIPEKLRIPGAALLTIAVILIGSFASEETADNTRANRAVSLFGLIVFVFALWLSSRNRKKIVWHTVIVGMLVQFIVALFVLRTKAGYDIFNFVSTLARELLGFADDGVDFLTETGFASKHSWFLVTVIPAIIFFVSLVQLLYYSGVLQWAIGKFAVFFFWSMRVSGAEAVVAAASPFIGQGESAMLIKPFVAHLTMAEIHQVMCSGFATIAGSVLVAYIGMGVNPQALVSSCVMGEEGEERNVYGGLSFSKDIVDQCGLMLWQNTRVCGALGKSWRRMTGLRRLRMRLRVGLAAMVSKSIFWDWIVGRTGLILRSTSWNERCWG